MSYSHETAARTLYGEARSEPEIGRRAVAWTFVNRFRSGAWFGGKSLGRVCRRHGQYSCWNDNDPNVETLESLPESDPMLVELQAIVEAAANGQSVDPTGGATHYYREGTPVPTWVAGNPSQGIPPATFIGKFGVHLFYKGVR